MKAFFVFKTSWYTNRVGTHFEFCGVFSTHEKADDFMDSHKLNTEIMEEYHLREYTVDEPEWDYNNYF